MTSKQMQIWQEKHPTLHHTLTFWSWAIAIMALMFAGYALGMVIENGQLAKLYDTLTATPAEKIVGYESILPDFINNSDFTDCPNDNVFELSHCLGDFVAKNFYYNDSEIGTPFNLERFYRQGGVCTHYSELYRLMAEYHGYRAKKVTYWGTPTEGHQFAIIYGKEGYCLADQGHVGCTILE